jgi:hypothetical protein
MSSKQRPPQNVIWTGPRGGKRNAPTGRFWGDRALY